MVASTRARARLRLCQVCDDFPTDLWIEVLSNLRGKDLGKIACVSKHFRSINDCVWQQACSKRWPEWTSIAQNPETQWRRQYELFELRDKELEAIPDLAAIKKKTESCQYQAPNHPDWVACRGKAWLPITNLLSWDYQHYLVCSTRSSSSRLQGEQAPDYFAVLHQSTSLSLSKLYFVRLVSLIINLA